MEKPLKRRIFVFAVRDRQRMRTKSGLYLGNSNRGNFTRAEDVWVLRAAEDCRYPWLKAQHLLISDAFELEPVELGLWDKYKDDVEFDYLKKFAEDCAGNVETCIIHEESILAEVTGDLIQDDTMW